MIFNLNFSVIVVFPGKRIGAEQKAATYHSCTNMQDDSLTRLTVDERSVAYKGAMPSKTGKRASDKGFLGMSFELYLKLLDWTGRQIRRDTKKGRIPVELAPIMERIGLSGELWCDIVKRFGKIFKRVSGTPESLAQEAICRGRSGFRTGSSPLPSAGQRFFHERSAQNTGWLMRTTELRCRFGSFCVHFWSTG